MLKYFFVLLQVLSITNSQIELEHDYCPVVCESSSDQAVCISSLTQKDCAEDEYLSPNGGICGCCPGCVEAAGLNERCNEETPCARGLKCAHCAASGKMQCQLDKSLCAYTYHLSQLRSLPTCKADGTFAAVQCKGDRLSGRCFCYSESGKRIFGWSWWRNSKDMTCACSRMKYKMIQYGRGDNTLHCDAMGNYEELQCTDGVCWCADPKTGQIQNGTRAVPEVLWKFLPCYDYGKFGSQYLRQCESAAYAQNLLRKAYAAHGTTNIEFNDIQCDYDGAYGRYSIVNGIAACYWRDGSKLGSFQVQSNKVSSMNCYCARDQKIFSESGMKHRLTCSGNGNYESIQDINGKIFCVDSDGFAVSDPIETDTIPQCSDFIYYEVKESC